MLLEVICERTDLEQIARDGRPAFLGHVTSAAIAEQLADIYRRRAIAEGIRNPVLSIRNIADVSGAALLI